MGFLPTYIWIFPQIWGNSFSIEPTLSSSLSSESINTTLGTLAALLQLTKGNTDDSYDGCYSHRHSTLLATSLWKRPSSLLEINSLFRSWALTLYKHRCPFREAASILRSASLSVGVFEVSKSHVEFAIDRELMFRRMIFHQLPLLGIDLVLSIDQYNRPLVRIEMENGAADLFAATAGCKDIHHVQSGRLIILRESDPPTSWLYISNDKAHLKDMSHAIHVKSVRIGEEPKAY